MSSSGWTRRDARGALVGIGAPGPPGATAPDATTTAKGLIQLAGDLTGTAASPQLAMDSVGTNEIAAGAIGTPEIADGVVSFIKLLGSTWAPFLAVCTYTWGGDHATRIVQPSGPWTVYYNPSGAFNAANGVYQPGGPAFVFLNWYGAFGASAYTMTGFLYSSGSWLGTTSYLDAGGDSVEGGAFAQIINTSGSNYVQPGGWCTVSATPTFVYGGFKIPGMS